MNRAAEVRRTAPSVPGYTRWEPQKNRDRGEQEKVQRNNGCKVSKFNKKCKSAHSEISINSTQDQDREGHSQVQFSKNAEKVSKKSPYDINRWNSGVFFTAVDCIDQ